MSMWLRKPTTKGHHTLTLEGFCARSMAYATIYINLRTSIINHVGCKGLCLKDMGARQRVHTHSSVHLGHEAQVFKGPIILNDIFSPQIFIELDSNMKQTP